MSTPRSHGDVLPFTPPPRPLRAGVLPFDPSNPAHLRAWESLWDLGQMEARNGR